MSSAALFKEFLDIKAEKALTYYDVHTNPGDVFDIGSNLKISEEQKLPGPSLLEYLDYSPVALRILGVLFRFFPAYMQNEVAVRYAHASQESFFRAFDEAGIDKAVALPALSDKNPLEIYNQFSDKRFLRLGTVDIHTLEFGSIQNKIKQQISELGIIGLKFNPNIQRFFPEPNRNTKEVRDKLLEVYRVANEEKLFLLVHGGVSYTPVFKKPNTFEYVTYGELQNFFEDNEEKSYLFSSFSHPVVIAHLGHYNSLKIRYDLWEKIVSQYEHVYFDTCGVSSSIIKKFIRRFGTSRIMFGSDMPYFDTKFAVIAVLRTLKRFYSGDAYRNKVREVFSTNFTDKILM